MALTPFYKPSGDEVRDMVRRNRENGEVEEGFETEKDEAQYFQHPSKEDYDQHVLKQKMNALEMYTMKTPEATDNLVQVEMAEAILTAEVTAEKSEFKIGNQTELTFRVQTVESKAPAEPKAENPKTIAEQSTSDMDEIMSYVDFGKWTKKGAGALFGVVKGLFGGLFSVAKDASKIEKPKTEAQLKADKKAKEQGAAKAAFYSRLEKAQAEAQASAQAILAKTMARLGLGGMSADMLNSYMGENRNLNSEEINVYTAFEVARKAEEAKKAQEKQVKDMQMAATAGPAINMDAAVEGGTGGGKANMSAVSAGG